MTRTQAAKLLGILHDRSQWWCVREAEGRQLLFDLGMLDLQSAMRMQAEINCGEWIDQNGEVHAVTTAEREKAPSVILRLVQSADAHFTLAEK